MTVSFVKGVACLSGGCGLDDVEPLLGYLQTSAEARIDLNDVQHLHGAVVQLLYAFAPTVDRPANDPFVRLLMAGLRDHPVPLQPD